MIDFSGHAKGWECPKCGSVYSPTTPCCFMCANSISSPKTEMERIGEQLKKGIYPETTT
jgi:uncharacterized OB-fold protein